MRHLLKSNLLYIFLLSLLGFISCNENTQNSCFKTKEDSIKFAKTVIAIYPETQGAKIADFGNNPNKSFGQKKFNPIDWDKVLEYAVNYDSNPLIKDKKGFMIDQRGLSLIKANNNYSQLYLRFGKYTNSSIINNDYTVMIIPLDGESEILSRSAGTERQGENSNYDELDPCPRACPKGFQ